jgi:hypothetical protein
VCVRRPIQCTCVDHDVRSRTYNRERGHIHPYIRACRHTKYKHACMPCTYTYLHSSAQRNSTYHAQTRPTTTHSCEQAMYCTHLSVWSVELWASTAAMCCAPSAPMELSSRLYAYLCVRKTIQRTCRSRCAIPYITECEVIYTHAYVHALHVSLSSFQYIRNSTYYA